MSASLFVIAASLAAAPPLPDSAAAPAASSATPAAAQSPAANPISDPPPPEPAPSDQPDTSGIVVTARGKPPKSDPMQQINLQSFEAVQAVDRAIVGPIAMTYAHKVPHPIRSGVHNVLVLLDEPTVIVNFLLQHRIGKAAAALARFTINATFGVAGLFDVAGKRPFNLRHRSNGFADTMGFYGVKTGAYLYVPLIGSTTVRDLTGRLMDLSLLSFTVGGVFSGPYYSPARGVLASIDDRVEFDADLRRLRDESPDGYSSIRKYYLDKRQAEIDALHDKQPVPEPVPLAAPTP